jgi:hypothetical protein
VLEILVAFHGLDPACYGRRMSSRSILERIIEERTGQSYIGTVSVAVERLADEFAREAMADPEFRRSIREMVRAHSKALSESLQGQRRERSPKPKRARRRRRAIAR